jgi:hypothetical protein
MMAFMFFAQSFGEYGGSSGVGARMVRALESAAQWVELSLREDRPAWIAAIVFVVFVLWLFRRR